MNKMVLAFCAMFATALLALALSGGPALAKDCWIGTIKEATACPPPPPIVGKVKSTEKFRRECVWLPFPVGKVGKPIVFFTRESDARCLGKNWQRPCPDCTDWIRGKRGPVHGPARNAVIAIRLHDGLSGLSVPRDAYDRIVRDAGWCWFGKSGVYDSHYFTERPF